ncbi:MAG TPA: histidine kinase [Pseudonocardia sp.]|jgi:signal transduction histidine kinase
MIAPRGVVLKPGPWWQQALGVLLPAAIVWLSGPGPFRWSLPVSLAVCVLLPLRFRGPRLMVAACVPALVAGLGWAPSMVALYTLGRATGRRAVALFWAAVCCGSATLTVLFTQHLRWPDMVLTTLTASLYSGAPAVLGMLLTTRQELQRSLLALEAAREATVAAREEVARAAERDRIGREIHDSVGHHATMIAVGAAALAATSKDPEAREAAERLRVLAKRALAEMRAALGLLGADSELGSGIAALPELVARARETGMHVRMIGHDTLGHDIPLGVQRTVYRLIQESLTNAAKHAEGSEVEVHVERWAAELRVTVTNDRPPRPKLVLPTAHSGGGLAGLAERMGQMGGRLRARPTSKGGFSVQGRLPSPPLDPDRRQTPVADLPAVPPAGYTKVASDRATNDGGAPKELPTH